MKMRIYIMLLTISIVIMIESYGLCEEFNMSLDKKGVTMSSIEKSVNSIDRYKNISTAPAAIKLQLKDIATGEKINVVIGNDDLSGFLIAEKIVKDYEDYVNYMIKNEGAPLEINIDNLKKALGRRWSHGKVSLSEEYFKEYVSFEEPMTFEELGVKDEQELLKKFFDFDYAKGTGVLKVEYYEKYTRNPAFIALLIDLGYYVTWGDIAPVLNISTTASIK
jgi:hypothetical protein